MKITLNEGKGGYKEVMMKDVIAELGGLEAIKKNVKGADAAYDLILSGQKAVAKRLHDQGAREVGELDASVIADWADNNFNQA
jgi:hypothetical protein